MRSACWHHDDFLFERQFSAAEQPKEFPLTAGDELLARFRRKLRIQSQFTPRPIPQSQAQPQPDVVGVSFYPPFARTFQTVFKDYVAKHPPQSPQA